MLEIKVRNHTIKICGDILLQLLDYEVNRNIWIGNFKGIFDKVWYNNIYQIYLELIK
jgi:hypothetical protein